MADLRRLVDDYFRRAHRHNPPLDAQALFNDFLDQIQKHGEDLGEWNEGDWRSVMPEFGVETEEAILDALENVAGWGVVDDFVWTNEAEQDIEDDIER